MHRAGRKKSRESSQAPSSSTRRREPEPRQAYNEDYGKKVVYVSLGGRSEFESWAMIDPNYEKYGQVESDKIIFQPVEDTEKLPDLCEVLGCGYVNYESKIYVIGGLAKGPGEVGPRVKSNRVFIYDLISKSWEESPSRLNICRRSPQVFVAGKVIYVVGGLSNDDHYPSRKTYVEFYDFDSVPQRWELLYTSVPNKALSPGRYPFSGALYERCNQFLMCTPRFGIFAFDYVKRTWIDMRSHHHLTDYFSDCLAQVIIVDDILFGASFSTIIAYHLKKKKILSKYSLEQDPYLRLVREPTLRLFCVNNDTLLLMCCLDQYTLEPSKKIYCCRYRIDYSSEETCGIRLVRDGSQIFQAKGDFIGPFLLVKQDIATMNMTDSGKHHTEVLNWSNINISQRSTVLQQPPTENKRYIDASKSLFLVLKFEYGGYRGMMYSFKVDSASGKILSKKGLVHIHKFYDRDDYIMRAVRPFECARLCGSSLIYFLFNKGYCGKDPLPPPPEGVIYDTNTQSEIKSFTLPAEKPYGPLISAYGKLYHFSDPCSYPCIPSDSFEFYDPPTDRWELLPFCPFYRRGWIRLKTIGYAVCSGCIIFSLAHHFTGQWELIMFCIGTKEWHEVCIAGSALDEHYPFEGRAVVLNDIIYTVSKYSGNVIIVCKLRTEPALNSTCKTSIFLDTLAVFELNMASPPIPFESLALRYLVCIGDNIFCLLTTARTYKRFETYVCATTFMIKYGEDRSLHLCTLDARVLQLYHPENSNGDIALCFTPDWDDTKTIENQSGMLQECAKFPERATTSDAIDKFKYKFKKRDYITDEMSAQGLRDL